MELIKFVYIFLLKRKIQKLAKGIFCSTSTTKNGIRDKAAEISCVIWEGIAKKAHSTISSQFEC